VDNGSTDGTCEYVRTFFPWVKLIHCAEKGSGHARNAGIREARGEFILSTDSDCVIDKHWMTHLISAFEATSVEVAAIGGKILPYSTRSAVERYEPSWAGQPDITRIDPAVRYTAAGNAAFRASALRRVGEFDGTGGHDDTDLGIRLVQAGYRIEYTDHALVRHRNPATLGELYEHRVKYGICNFTLVLCPINN
jgi:GT2 family glycosyltransferase